MHSRGSKAALVQKMPRIAHTHTHTRARTHAHAHAHTRAHLPCPASWFGPVAPPVTEVSEAGATAANATLRWSPVLSCEGPIHSYLIYRVMQLQAIRYYSITKVCSSAFSTCMLSSLAHHTHTRTHTRTHARTHTHTHARTWFHVHVVLIGVSAACVSCAVFNVEQDSSPKIVGIAASNDTLFTVTDLQPATAYTFVVRARNKYGESAIGAAVTITTRDAREFPVAFVCVSVCVRVCLFVCACLSTCTHVRPASGCIHSHTHTHARTQHVRTRSAIGPWSPVCSSDWRRERCAVGSPRAAQREHHAV